MADADFRSSAIEARVILPTDLMFAATPTEADLSEAAKSVTIEDLIEFIFENPPDDLTPPNSWCSKHC